MKSHELCLLLVTCLIARAPQCSIAIRVTWGTNQGPIVPPTPRTTQAPRLPYREPAPVWEDQSDDIPNPNPYVYVLPPPSRQRTWPIPIGPYDNRDQNAGRRPNNYGVLVPPPQQYANNQNNNNYNNNNNNNVNTPVAALSPQIVPGVGKKYTAIVGITDKLQGKYNVKTKKYKAYEKIKYWPMNYYRLFDPESQYVPQRIDADQMQLPLQSQPIDWQAAVGSTTKNYTTLLNSTTTTIKTTTIEVLPTTTTTTTTTTKQPTTTTTTTESQHLIGNFKVAHEKVAYTKRPMFPKKMHNNSNSNSNSINAS